MGDTKFYRHPDEFRERVRSHLLHDLASMDLQSDFADMEECSGLFV